jgi:hypothetical protein
MLCATDTYRLCTIRIKQCVIHLEHHFRESQRCNRGSVKDGYGVLVSIIRVI